MKIVFAGSPAIAVPSLLALARLSLEDDRFQLAGVLTNPDSKRGRRGESEPTDVGAATDRLSGAMPAAIPQCKPATLDGAVRDAIAALKPDLLVSFAYGRIFSPAFLSIFPLGGINVHPSLLPKYRGATPIPAAILGRETETGVTIQRLAREMDAGDILAQETIPLCGRETTESLSTIAAEKGAELLIRVVRDSASRENGTLDKAAGRRQNNDAASYCGLIRSEDGRIDWSQPAADIDAKIRAYTPWPLCRTVHGKEILYILEAEPRVQAGNTAPGVVLGIDKKSGILVQTGDGVLAVRRLQYAAKKALAWRDFLNGARDFIGARLTG